MAAVCLTSLSRLAAISRPILHLLHSIAFAVLEIQTHMVDTGRPQAFEKLQDHIAPGAQTQVSWVRVNGPGGPFRCSAQRSTQRPAVLDLNLNRNL